MRLSECKPGENVKILYIGGEGELRQHLLDMGILPGVHTTIQKFAPMGDPIEIQVRGYELTLRLEDAQNIEVEPAVLQNDLHKRQRYNTPKEHPGLGEIGKYHDSKNEHPLSEDTVLSFALAGNQNSGKTTLFNALTGSNQHVGNFPGVTVDQKTGVIKGYPKTEVTDLPGIYSLSPYSNEEIVSRQFILESKPTAIINIVDATNIERNLYLTLQLMELGFPMVLAVNMMDELTNNGGSIRINEMEEILGIPVVPIAAIKNEGIDELVRHAIHIAKYQEKPSVMDFCSKDDNGGAVHRCLHGIMHLIYDHAEAAEIPVRFAATKIVEGDSRVLQALSLKENEKEMLEHIIVQMEEERGLDRAAAIADMRYTFIQRICEETVVKPHESIEAKRSSKIDHFLTGKYTAIPAFILIMSAVFYLTFNVIGLFLQNMLELGIEQLTILVDTWMTHTNVNPVLHSLMIDGIFEGVGSVLSFVPIIVILFFFLSILEDSGYMARIAFVMDKLLRKIGLSGRSIVPLLIGFGCTVPGVMASRTLPSDRDRKMTILLTPFMSCSAKLPIYGFFCNAFFPQQAGLIMILLYVIGIAMAVLLALFSKNTIFQGEAVPFVMELPNYRLPAVHNVLHLMWDKAKDFIQRAFSIILIATIVVWFLRTFDFGLNFVDEEISMLSTISGIISPIFKPVGFSDWRIITALIVGFLAKESVAATLSVLFGSTAMMAASLTTVDAFGLLVFCLLYTPCVAAISSVKRELGTKWAVGVLFGQCAIAWMAAFLIHTVGGFIF